MRKAHKQVLSGYRRGRAFDGKGLIVGAYVILEAPYGFLIIGEPLMAKG